MIYINGSPLNVTIFPDKTSQVWQVPELEIPNISWVSIKWEFSHESEFMHLAQLKALIDKKWINCSLHITYLPYGRQDKDVSNKTAFALQTFAHQLNALHFSEIFILDPHSQRAIDLINNSVDYYPTDNVRDIIRETNTDILCYPDAGALDKYNAIYQEPYVYGEKVRDQITARILSYTLKGRLNPGTNVLIVDDICDGGATFVLLAKELVKAGAGDVNLFVTHGLFTKGLKPLYDAGIKRIFTKDGEASEVQNKIVYRRL